MFRLMFQLIGYTCVATVLALLLGVAHLFVQGRLSKENLFQMMAIVHNVDLAMIWAAGQSKDDDQFAEQHSYEAIEKRRAIEARHLEFKMNNLQKDLEEVRTERQLVDEDREQLKRLMADFDQQLEAAQERAQEVGIERQRQIWTKVKPALAKDQIMSMVEAGEIDNVVLILGEMPATTQAKIVSAFGAGQDGNEEETDALDRILRLMRRGIPTTAIVDETLNELDRR